MKEIIIAVPDGFGQELKPEKVNSEIRGELVRCKDCRYYHGKNEGCGAMGFYPPSGDWFCAYGEMEG